MRRRKLGVELRKLRLDLRLRPRDVARDVGWSTSKLSDVERGQVAIASFDLKVLLDYYYGVEWLRRMRSSIDDDRLIGRESWSTFSRVHSGAFLAYLWAESSAATIRSYQGTFVPGLLQTEEYARAVLGGVYDLSGEDIDRRWEVRQRRQELHEREGPPVMHFLVDEAAVRQRAGGFGIMRRQLERLIDWSNEPHITLQVIPVSAGAHPGLKEPFTLLEFEHPYDDMLYLEQVSDERGGADRTFRDNPEQIRSYAERFARLEETALSSEDTVVLLNCIIQELGEVFEPCR